MNRLFTADEVLRIGLLCVGFDSSRQVRVQRTTNERRFQSYYGSSPLVCSAIWEGLITSTKEDQIPHPPKSATFDKFLFALYFLKEYPTEEKLAGMWHTCEKSARQWVWFFVGRIQALKAKKVRSILCCCHIFICLLPTSTTSNSIRLYGQRRGPRVMRHIYTRWMVYIIESMS